MGLPGWGTQWWNGSGVKFTAVVTFMDHPGADELTAVQDSVIKFGKAQRDQVYYVVPEIQAGILRMGYTGWAVNQWGPLAFDLGSSNYYLGVSALPGATVSTDSEDTNYPFGNLFDYNHSSVWRSDASTSAWFVAACSPGAKPVAQAVLLDHNLTNAAIITLEANASDSWASPAYSKNLIWTETNIREDIGQTYQYWRLVISDPGNPSGYLTASTFFLGSSSLI